MSIWTSMLIPVVFSAVLIVFFPKKTVWWEIILPFVVSIICIFICKAVAESVSTSDNEFWGGWVMRAENTLPWDEKISCDHPIYSHHPVTHTHRDSKGRRHTTVEIERYISGYEHNYDVRHHGSRYYKYGSNGEAIEIGEAEYDSFLRKWHGGRKAECYHPSSLSKDEKIIVEWDRKDETLVPFVTLHSFVNKVQVSELMSKMKEIQPGDEAKFGLYNYPTISNYNCPSVLGTGYDFENASNYLTVWNSKLGALKKVRMWLLVFKDKPVESALMQESFWKGGKKNDVVVCVGVGNDENLSWVHVFSWTSNSKFNGDLANEISGGESHGANLLEISKKMVEKVKDEWVYRSFESYNYLDVIPSKTAKIWTWIIVFVFTLVVFIFVLVNDMNPQNPIHLGDFFKNNKSVEDPAEKKNSMASIDDLPPK